MFTVTVKQNSGRGEAITDKEMNIIKARYSELYKSFTNASKEDQDALKKEMNNVSAELGDAFASGD